MFAQCTFFKRRKRTIVWWYLRVSESIWSFCISKKRLYICNVRFFYIYIYIYRILLIKKRLFALFCGFKNTHSILLKNVQTNITYISRTCGAIGKYISVHFSTFNNLLLDTTRYAYTLDVTRYIWDNISVGWDTRTNTKFV